ncbi:Cell Wall Hydrolase [Devosia lucknowensis]|uniref:Cell Wall Hydrolase n=1 Tax=Devosia lucknowensis TaxID=1096929 RepID=A0A1Y6EHF2_9HYPH|nr:Cell Wall Hydrolase [Devosia lucknowensis]
MAVVTPLAYIGLAGAALGPGSAPLGGAGLPGEDSPIAIAQASLSYSGVDPIITGSVDHLFDSVSFTGPNRAEKTNRVRPVLDAAAISQSFEAARMQIAALRAPSDPAALGQSSIAEAESETESGPRMSVASLHPGAAAALDAIAGIAPRSDDSLGSVTMPDSVPEQLAYARANTPPIGSMGTGDAIQVSDREHWCLATAIYFEARGESYRGQVAVAQVVLNRVKDHRYPDTICGVVFQNQHRRNACQFSFACDGIPEVVTERRPWDQAEEIATKVASGELYLTEVGDATHYHATYVRPAWAPRMTKVTQIGLHVFYKFKTGWLFG